MSNESAPAAAKDERPVTPGAPVVYHLDDGDTAPGIFLKWETGIGPKTAKLRVLLFGPMLGKYTDRDGWFSKHYLDHWMGCPPECCDMGTAPGEFEFVRVVQG